MKTLLVAFLAVCLAYGLAYSHTDLTPAEVEAFLDTAATVIVVDVREEYEFCDSTYSPPGHIPGALNMPWNSGYFEAHYGDLPADENIVIVCRSGNRSNSAANFLDAAGFTRVFDMTGGMNQWLWETEVCPAAGAPGAIDGVPGSLALGSASPNPFTRSTRIAFAVPAGGPGEAELGIYDARGRLVRHSVLSGQRSGAASVVWDGTDSEGRPVTSGLYFYRLTWKGESRTRRVVLLR